jgi:Mrp family chromosome partitioning ATPase
MIPPNPTELLSNGRYDLLLEELRGKYDYIILDTAPLLLVTDTFLIAELADVTIYVSRSNIQKKHYWSLLMSILIRKRSKCRICT